TGAIRNPIGAAMAVRRGELTAIGGFSDRLGRVGALPTGCEETMMGIELTRRNPQARIVRHTPFAVSHSVPDDRTTLSYFVRRCFNEGRSKAILTRLCGRQASLKSERAYTTRTLPLGIWHARRRPSRVLALVVGLIVTTTGYLVGLVQTTKGEDARW
ncbi:MAG: glycosyltransferase family 2 protein, partial [Mycobacterium sp.]|nr:glycosyltransferase family 2 protein [Mycobacterium sp.]